MQEKDRNLDRLSDTHTCYQGPWRHADVPSSFNESLVAPPPGATAGAVSKGSIAKFWHQSINPSELSGEKQSFDFYLACQPLQG